MRDRGLSDIAEGQEEVFRVADRQRTWAKAPLWHPSLGCTLVCPMVLTVVALALTINVFWIRSFEFGVQRRQDADDAIIAGFNNSSEHILYSLARQQQAISAISALERISKFLRWPPTVSKLNAEAFAALEVAEPNGVDAIFETMWAQISSLFLEVDYIFFGFAAGGFMAYERLPTSFTTRFRYGAEFVLPKHWAPGRCEECSWCPPARACVSGKKLYYFVDSFGKFLELYEPEAHLGPTHAWYVKAVQGKGDLVWTDVHNHSSGHAQGFAAMTAVYNAYGTLQGVSGAAFTMHYLHRFLESITGFVAGEEGFIVDTQGWILANSLKLRDQRYRWQNASSPVVQAAMRTLIRKFGTLASVPENSTHVTQDGRYIFTVERGDGARLQAEDWIVVIICEVSAYMNRTWQQQELAVAQSASLTGTMEAKLTIREISTAMACCGFALLGGLLMACVGCAVTNSLKQISLEMLSLARLEFLPRRKRHSTRALVRGSMQFLSANPEVSDTESGSEEDLEKDCWTTATPKEVANIRESFLYMVAGLKSFARYMDPEIMRILVHSKRQAQLGMSKAEVTIFFSDVANFTTMAEAMEPESFMAMLCEYLDEMSKIIMSKRGIVGEFIGDAIMAWWNVPINLGRQHTELAFDAAIAQQLRLLDLREEWLERGWPILRVRMGLAMGQVLAGNMGSERRMKYSLVGDSVDLAARLESLCKYYGVTVIAESTAASAPGVREKYHMRKLDLVALKNFPRIELWEVLAVRESQLQLLRLSIGREVAQEQLRYFIEGYSEIHELYRAGALEECHACLERYCEEFPQDQPSQKMSDRVRALLGRELPADWSPVHELFEK